MSGRLTSTLILDFAHQRCLHFVLSPQAWLQSYFPSSRRRVGGGTLFPASLTADNAGSQFSGSAWSNGVSLKVTGSRPGRDG